VTPALQAMARHRNVADAPPQTVQKSTEGSLESASPFKKRVPMTQLISITDPSTPPDSRTSKPPSSRGGLRLLCRLGQGGMAEVHLASRSHFSGATDLVVIKRMHQQHVDDPATVRMFLDEAQLALALSHPNIVRTERLGTFGGRHGIVMEFLEGQPFHLVLKRAWESDGSLNLDLVVQVAIAALDGLHYAHELKDPDGVAMNIVHRDISPQNLFVTYDGAVKLLDFGIAKNSLQDGRTRTGLLKGKISYMAPEQARGETLDRRADLWSLGVMLWEAVTGTRLFKGPNEAATLNLTLSEEVAPPSQRRSDLPKELEAILMRALERDPSKRYASAAAMRDDLEAWLTGRAFTPDSLVSSLMQRLFSKEMATQREQINQLLRAPAEPTSESGVTLLTPLLGASTTMSGLRATQMSSVTDLMHELTRQRRATTRLLTTLVCLVGAVAVIALYWLLQGRQTGAAVAVAAHQSAPLVRESTPPRAEALAQPAPPPPARTTAARAPIVPVAVPVARAQSAAGATTTTRAARRNENKAEPPAPSESQAATQTGTLNFDTTPWSIVSSGGRPLGQTPLIGATLPAGTHTLILTNPELGIKTSYQVVIAAGRTTARRIGLE
jgi:serine/threonine protein kinase